MLEFAFLQGQEPHGSFLIMHTNGANGLIKINQRRAKAKMTPKSVISVPISIVSDRGSSNKAQAQSIVMGGLRNTMLLIRAGG